MRTQRNIRARLIVLLHAIPNMHTTAIGMVVDMALDIPERHEEMLRWLKDQQEDSRYRMVLAIGLDAARLLAEYEPACVNAKLRVV